MIQPPRDIQAHSSDRLLRIDWGDRRASLPFRFLRQSCQCARCVNEWTGEQILDPESVADDVSIERVELVGNYAIRIRWSDGHDSGLYTWERLSELSPSK